MEFRKKYYTVPTSGEKIEYQVYVQNGKENIQEAEAIRLADRVGITSMQVEEIKPVKDRLYFCENNQSQEVETKPEGTRYVATGSCVDEQGKAWRTVGSAAPDSLDYNFWRYAPEMAAKRAMVRVILRALKLTDLNADIEMPSMIQNNQTQQNQDNQDNNEINNQKKNTKNAGDVSEKEVKSLLKQAREKGFTNKKELSNLLSKFKVKDVYKMDRGQYDSILEHMNKAEKNKKESTG